MSNIIPQNFGALSTRFQQVQAVDDLSSGIQTSFGIIGYRGKVWSIRYRGEEQQLMREDGDGPRGSIEVVILKASQHISKIYYAQGYVEGSNAAPDCFSNNGVAPDPSVANPICSSCAICPMNAWGSRTTPAGKAGKACSDSKRLAVVPAGDIANEVYGGPMLLRVPAASLNDLASFGQKMNQLGYPYFSIATKISFDPSESYPKFIFSAFRPLNDQEAEFVLTEREGHQVTRILSENEFATATPGVAAVADQNTVFEQPPVQQQPVQQQPVQQQPVQQQPVQQANGFGVTQPQQQPVQQVAQPVQQVAQPVQQVAQPVQQPVQQVAQPVQQANGFGVTQPVQQQPVQQQPVQEVAQPVQEVAQPVQQSAQQVQPEPQQSEQQGVTSAFEMELDGLLADILPAGN